MYLECIQVISLLMLMSLCTIIVSAILCGCLPSKGIFDKLSTAFAVLLVISVFCSVVFGAILGALNGVNNKYAKEKIDSAISNPVASERVYKLKNYTENSVTVISNEDANTSEIFSIPQGSVVKIITDPSAERSVRIKTIRVCVNLKLPDPSIVSRIIDNDDKYSCYTLSCDDKATDGYYYNCELVGPETYEFYITVN